MQQKKLLYSIGITILIALYGCVNEGDRYVEFNNMYISLLNFNTIHETPSLQQKLSLLDLPNNNLSLKKNKDTIYYMINNELSYIKHPSFLYINQRGYSFLSKDDSLLIGFSSIESTGLILYSANINKSVPNWVVEIPGTGYQCYNGGDFNKKRYLIYDNLLCIEGTEPFKSYFFIIEIYTGEIKYQSTMFLQRTTDMSRFDRGSMQCKYPTQNKRFTEELNGYDVTNQLSVDKKKE